VPIEDPPIIIFKVKGKMEDIVVLVASAEHEFYVDTILQTISDAAKVRGTGIARRTHEYILTKMREAKAILALDGERFAGFSYIETWGNKQYVTTSGLIVHPDYRGRGIAKKIKDMTFSLARTRWPHAKIFSLTSGAAVMAMNTQLGYKPVTFDNLTDDEAFWQGCNGCVNVDILKRTNRKYCICTAMLYDPEEHLPAKIPQDVLDRIKELDKNEETKIDENYG
jgi:GNAT superfamily N-acetyltransferase